MRTDARWWAENAGSPGPQDSTSGPRSRLKSLASPLRTCPAPGSGDLPATPGTLTTHLALSGATAASKSRQAAGGSRQAGQGARAQTMRLEILTGRASKLKHHARPAEWLPYSEWAKRQTERAPRPPPSPYLGAPRRSDAPFLGIPTRLKRLALHQWHWGGKAAGGLSLEDEGLSGPHIRRVARPRPCSSDRLPLCCSDLLLPLATQERIMLPQGALR